MATSSKPKASLDNGRSDQGIPLKIIISVNGRRQYSYCQRSVHEHAVKSGLSVYHVRLASHRGSGQNASIPPLVTDMIKDPLMRRIEGAPMIPPALLHDQMPHPRSAQRKNVIFEWVKNFQFRAKKIDVISRVLFPSSFGVFNILYWSYYLTQDNKKPD